MSIFDLNLEILHGNALNVPASLFMLLEEAKEAAMNERPPAIVFETVKGREISIFGIRMQYRMFPLILEKALGNLELLLEDLSLGFDFSLDIAKVRDDPSCLLLDRGLEYLERGYSDTCLLSRIYRNPHLRQRFLLQNSNGRLNWQTSTVANYLKKYDEFIQELCFAIHLLSGMPARGTELETYQIRNTASCQKSVFFERLKSLFLLPIFQD